MPRNSTAAPPDPAVPDPAVPDPAVPDPAVPDPAVPDPAVPDPAGHHRVVAGVFTDRVLGTLDWSAPAPVAGWTARDVVEHLVTWLPGFLAAGGVALPSGPAVAEDPVGAWQAHAAAVQALLDDPDGARRPFAHPVAGAGALAEVIDTFY